MLFKYTNSVQINSELPCVMPFWLPTFLLPLSMQSGVLSLWDGVGEEQSE